VSVVELVGALSSTSLCLHVPTDTRYSSLTSNAKHVSIE
jgi:hypothetical protein